MQRLLQIFLDIALWRKGPQDLPASTTLLALAAMWYAGVSYAQVRLFGFDAGPSLLLTIVDIAMVYAWLTFTLSLLGLRSRLMQALTAVFGVDALVTLLDVAIRGISLLSGGNGDGPVSWQLLRLILTLLLTGRIFAIALERGLMTGVGITLAMSFSARVVAGLFVDLNSVAGGVQDQ